MDLGIPLIIIFVFFSVVCHEIAHGYTSYLLGDPTAYRMGRLTFNPLPHIDIFGTILLPLFLVLSGSAFLFAWAKPVPINPAYFRNPRKGMMLVAIAGPATNLALALVFTLLLHLVGRMLPDILQHSIAMAALINIVLMVFNLLPIPPLDGSRIVARFLKGRALWNYSKIEPFGMYIVFGLLFLGVFSSILTPVLRISFRLLGISPYLH